MKLLWFAVYSFCILHHSIAGNTFSVPNNDVSNNTTHVPNNTTDVPKDAIEGGVDYAIKSSIVPAHVRQALAIGKAVYEKYLKDSGDSTDENEKALETVIGSKAGRGLSLDTVKDAIGNAWELVMASPLISQNNKKALAAGRAAYERFLERTAQDSDKNVPIFSAEDVKSVVDGSVNYAIGSSVVPLPAKGVLATGKALKKGWQTFRDTRNLTEVKMAIVGSSLESVDDIARTSPCVTIAKAGTGLAKDLYDGKDVKTAATDRGQEALVTIGGGVVEVIIDVVKGLKNGQILDALKRGKEALKLVIKVNQSEPVEIEYIEMQPIANANENDTVAVVDEQNVDVANL